MKLVNPGAGDISDRLTLLALKIYSGQEQGIDVAHFETERAALLTKIHSRTLNGKWFDAVLELGAVNALLWHTEDDLREIRARAVNVSTKEDYQEGGRIAFRIQGLNDRRAELVSQINREAGDGDAKEKGSS